MLCTNNNRCKLTAITLGRESDALPPCPTSFQHHNLEMSIIIITRPKPAYGRQGLAGWWGHDTYQAGTFWDVLNVSLRASGAQLGYKLIWKTNLEL